MQNNCVASDLEPFCYVLSPDKANSKCDQCFRSLREPIYSCNRCKIPKYCCHACKKESLLYIHKDECEFMAKQQPKDQNQFTRLWARLLILFKNGRRFERQYISETKYVTFDTFLLPKEQIKRRKCLQMSFNMDYANLKEYLTPRPDLIPELQEAKQIYYRLLHSTVSIRDNKEAGMNGIGFYLILTSIQHRCKANAVIHFKGINMDIKTISEISKDMTISDVNICYTFYQDFYMLFYSHSTNYLRAQIECNCNVCEDENFDSIVCRNEDCREYYLFSKRKCPKCNHQLSKSFRKKYNELKTSAYLSLTTLKSDKITNLRQLQATLQKLQGYCDPCNGIVLQVTQVAAQISMINRMYDLLVLYGEYIVNGYEFLLGPYGPTRLTALLSVAETFYIMTDYENALKRSNELFSLVITFNDPDYWLYKQATNLLTKLYDIMSKPQYVQLQQVREVKQSIAIEMNNRQDLGKLEITNGSEEENKNYCESKEQKPLALNKIKNEEYENELEEVENTQSIKINESEQNGNKNVVLQQKYEQEIKNKSNTKDIRKNMTHNNYYEKELIVHNDYTNVEANQIMNDYTAQLRTLIKNLYIKKNDEELNCDKQIKDSSKLRK